MLPTLIRPAKRLKLSHPHLRISRNYSTESPSVLPTLNDPLQAYISTTRDPYLNLSIEHYLFSKSRPGSKVLFVYTNRPCVVIGRNQNPWIEANLALLKNPQQKSSSSGNVTDEGSQPKLDVTSPIDLVRRRSGGGTVFHDLGNVNWSVTVDADSFTRDKHAQMVVQALRKLGIYRARVNERHDIVLDLGKATEKLDNLRDLHDTPYRDEKGKVHSLKVSGSAFRIAKGRALHHGTALCGSGNLEGMSEVLRAPGRRWFEAKGVESVKSEVGNLDIQNNIFEYAVLKEFMRFYGSAGGTRRLVEPRAVGKEMLEIKEVKKGVEELMSPEWLYTQTPAFTFTFPLYLSGKVHVQVNFHVRHGTIEKVDLVDVPDFIRIPEGTSPGKSLYGKKLHEIRGGRGWKRALMGQGLLNPEDGEARVWNEDAKEEDLSEFLGRVFAH